MIALVQCGTDKIIHPGIYDHKSLYERSLDVQNPCQEHAGIANDESTRFQQDPQGQILEQRNRRVRILLDRQSMLRFVFPPDFVAAFKRALINNPDSTTDTKEFNSALRFQ